MMRDLNIGDVLVCEDGKLRGIVTDRDLTINVLTNGADSNAPVQRYMTTDVVTGAPDWSLEQVANEMGKHQIRRLPIVEDDKLIGIVSLGDVAIHTPKRDKVAESLKNISEATRIRFNAASPLAKFAGIAIPVALGTALLIFANSKSGQKVRQQLEASDLASRARGAVTEAVHALQDPKTRQAAFDALEATGLPERTRQMIHEGTRTVQDAPRQAGTARERVMQFADDARSQAQHLPEQVTRRFQKPKPKRFIFA
jgi:hypothetical protein